MQSVWLQDHQPLPCIIQLPTHKQPTSGHLCRDGGTFGGEWVDHKFCYGVHRCQPEGEVKIMLWELVKKKWEKRGSCCYQLQSELNFVSTQGLHFSFSETQGGCLCYVYARQHWDTSRWNLKRTYTKWKISDSEKRVRKWCAIHPSKSTLLSSRSCRCGELVASFPSHSQILPHSPGDNQHVVFSLVVR